MIQFHALGGLTVTEHGEEVAVGGPRQRRLLAMLLIHRNAVVSVDRLADAVFAGEPTPAASTTLRSYIARIRKVADGVDPEPRVVTQAPGYLLRLPAEAFDVARFEGLLADARSRLAREDPAGAAALLREGLALWRGDAYEEFADEDWARPESQRLGELRLVAYESLFDAELACGRAVEVIPEIEALTAVHEMREAFRAQLMIALYRAGRQAEALAVFRDYRAVLVEDLGLDPTPGLEELERQILAHDPSLLLAQPAGLPLRGYRLGERLGTGRDGTVYAARLPGVDRDFVIRVIEEAVADRPDVVRTFDARAQRLASLRHPAIVTLQDFWREPGAAYLVMRRLHGGTLTDRLGRRPMTDAEVASLVDRVGGALVAAAEVGISHGRLSADNVLFDDAGDACLADFSPLAPRPDQTGQDDVAGLAALVGACLPDARSAVVEVLERGATGADRPSMADFVALLTEALAGATTDEGPPANPYKGLRAFDEADAPDYYGRADLVEQVLARLAGTDPASRLVLVVGGSGTGKSSVVRAGLVPRLRDGAVEGSAGWFITTMLPGASPFDALAEALRQVAVVETDGLAAELAENAGSIDRVIRRLLPENGQMLLVVDQFEELFTAASDRDQRAFLDGVLHALAGADSRLRVVATLRADFYDRPLAIQGFGAVVNDATVTIAAMAPAELEAAIVGPAERVGRRVEGALVAELVNAVADEPAALPALQFTLFELAAVCRDTLTLSAYRELGEVDGAIAARAEALYRSLDDDERIAVRRLFERLVVVGGDGEPTRRRALRAELTGVPADPVIDAAIEAWAEARLLGLDRHPQTREPTVELAHEALLREWPRLRNWIDEDREALLALGHLREAAASWVELDRDPGALYRGARLQGALDVTEARADHLSATEREFVDASRQEREREEAAAAAAADRQVRANRRLRAQLAVIGIALVVALVGGVIAFDQRGQAEQERRLATVRELAAASEASLADDPERSVLLGLAAVGAAGDDEVIPEAVEALHRAVAASRLVASVPDIGGAVDWSPDGSVFVTEGPEESGLVDIRDAETGETVLAFPGHEIDVNDVAFSPDGTQLATTGDDGALRVWDVATGEEVAAFKYPDEGAVWGPSFSGDGSVLAASWIDQGIVRVFDLASGTLRSQVLAAGVFATSIRPDGEQIVVSNLDSDTVTVADVDSGAPVFTIGAGQLWVRDVAYSPDGQWIATTGGDATVRIWRADDGRQQFAMAGHTGAVNGVDWSPDGSRLASVSDDGTARVADVTDGGARERLTLSAQDTGNGLQSVSFSPDGGRMITGDFGLAATKTWDVSATGGAEWGSVQGLAVAPGARGSLAFARDGDGVSVATGGGTVSTFDIATGARRWSVGRPGGADLERFAVTPDETVVATSGDRLPVDLWDVATGDHLQALTPADAGTFVTDMAWSADGEHLAIALADERGGSVVVVDRSGAVQAELPEEDDVYIQAVSFNPSGDRLATTRDPYRDDPSKRGVRIWDWAEGEIVRTLELATIAALFDPTSDRVAAIGELEGTATVWDASTGEEVTQLPQSDALLYDVDFSADGRQLATAGADGTIRLWDADTGEELLVLRGHDVPMRSVVFGPDGTRLAAVDYDGVVRVWALDLDDLVAIASERVTRTLTDEECAQYLHVETCPEA